MWSWSTLFDNICIPSLLKEGKCRSISASINIDTPWAVFCACTGTGRRLSFLTYTGRSSASINIDTTCFVPVQELDAGPHSRTQELDAGPYSRTQELDAGPHSRTRELDAGPHSRT